jgi:tocopherol O-methyltransferase
MPPSFHCLDQNIRETEAVAERVRRHYDAWALLYRLFWGIHLHHGLFRPGSEIEKPADAQLELVRYCTSLVDLGPNREVLDVGCGYGATVAYLAQRYGCRCTGLTISAAQAEYARKQAAWARTDGLLQFILCNAETQPLGTCRYDLVWIVEASEHFGNRARFFQRAARALRPNRSLLLTCWAARAQTPQLQRLAELCVCREFQTVDTYVAQISAAGLRISHLEELTAQVATTWDIVRRRMLPFMATLAVLSRPVREFACCLGEIRTAFQSRDLQYWVLVARK